MELLNKGDTVLFHDGVRLEREFDTLEANEMQTNKTRDKVNAQGDVRLFRQISATETWHGYGESGFYNTQNGTGFLLGDNKKKARVVHTEILTSTMSRVMNVTADRIDFSRGAKTANAKGFVQGATTDPWTGERYEFWADQADFDEENNKVTLYGAYQPIVIQSLIQGRRTIKGDKIIYFSLEQRFRSEGNATAVFEEDRSNKNK